MADMEQVKERLALLLSLSDEQMAGITPLVQDALQFVLHSLREGANEEDSRVAGLAAAYCACQFSCTEEGRGLGSFAAGDVKLSVSDPRGGYRELLQMYLEHAGDLLQDTRFLFRAVEG